MDKEVKTSRCQRSQVVEGELLLTKRKFRIPDACGHENDGERMLMEVPLAMSGSQVRTGLMAEFVGSSRRRT
jgi:hypothetical protein